MLLDAAKAFALLLQSYFYSFLVLAPFFLSFYEVVGQVRGGQQDFLLSTSIFCKERDEYWDKFPNILQLPHHCSFYADHANPSIFLLHISNQIFKPKQNSVHQQNLHCLIPKSFRSPIFSGKKLFVSSPLDTLPICTNFNCFIR